MAQRWSVSARGTSLNDEIALQSSVILGASVKSQLPRSDWTYRQEISWVCHGHVLQDYTYQMEV